jgi:hypothetical protein
VRLEHDTHIRQVTMTSPNVPGSGPRETGLTVDASRLWPGGIATAVVAALVALAGVLVCRWLFGIPLLAPSRDGAYGDAHTTGVVLAAAGAAIVATALLHLLLLSTPARSRSSAGSSAWPPCSRCCTRSAPPRR